MTKIDKEYAKGKVSATCLIAIETLHDLSHLLRNTGGDEFFDDERAEIEKIKDEIYDLKNKIKDKIDGHRWLRSTD